MKILGIDYGRKKIGLALGDSDTKLAEPLTILRYKDIKILSAKIKKIVEEEKIGKIIVGVSEGKMAQESKNFGEEIEKICKVEVGFIDETLTSFDAQKLSIEAGVNRKKRKGMEDAYAAALILQNYLKG